MRTATESIDLHHIREKLEELKSGISEITGNEKTLLKNRAERMETARREMVRTEELLMETRTRRLASLATEHQLAADREHRRMQARAGWAQHAYHASRTAVANSAQGTKDRKIGKLQGEIIQHRQARHDELVAATEAHELFLKQLAGERATRKALIKSARRTFRSYLLFYGDRLLGKVPTAPEIDASLPPEQLIELHSEKCLEASLALDAADKLPLTKFFRFVPLWLLMALMPVLHIQPALRYGASAYPWGLLLVSELILLALWGVSLILARPHLNKVAVPLAVAGKIGHAAENASAGRVDGLAAAIKAENDEEGRKLNETFQESASEWKSRIAEGQRKLDAQFARIPAAIERQHARRLAAIDAAHEQACAHCNAEAETQRELIAASRAKANGVIESEVASGLTGLLVPWGEKVLPAYDSLASSERSSLEQFPQWSHETCGNWIPPEDASPAIRIGHIAVDPSALAGGLPHDKRLALPTEGKFTAPFSLGFPNQGSVMIESEGAEGDNAVQALNAIALRLLAAHPPGRASFVFIDPVGLGKDFAGLMHLADYEETLINNRIWTQGTQIEERLAELNDHIEKVIQMYLRNEYEDITAYNEKAGTIAEKYRFLVIAGYPAAFSETSAKRLRSIVASGARCGVHLLIHRDTRLPSPDPALDEELRKACLRITLKDHRFHLANSPQGADIVAFDPAPSPEDAVTLVHRIGKASIDSNRVQVPFSHISPPQGELWSLDTTDELRVPIGRAGAKKLQMLTIGKGTRQHVLVAGKTGSGKSTLFHVIITNLALWCSPEQVEFYLVDFKKGVEFKCYAARRLPHAKVIAIESDREFALSVLQRIDVELKRRGELFRHAGSQDLAGYKRTPGHEPLPRSLLMIDEFQEFFTEDDSVAQEASLLLDRIVRQGRAFGIHVILGSQTLGGAYTLARATLGQMVIRIALQCNEADAHLIMEDDNPAPRMLTRPGEGIYNDQAGAFAANSPFQIVWLPEEERDGMLDEVNRLASMDGKTPAAPIIFEGNAPADIRDNNELKHHLSVIPDKRPVTSRAWLGAPNSIKGPTEAVFQRQSGSHLLIVGQSAERSLSMLLISVASLAAQYPPDKAEFVILDPHMHDSGADGMFSKLAAAIPHRIRIGGTVEAPELLASLAAEQEARGPSSGRDAPEVFLIVHDLQRFKALRPEDEFRFSMDDDTSGPTPSQAFAALLGEGGPVGMHVLAATDTWNNVSRWIPRKLMAEFEMRVLFQMSANDSSNLIDSPAATSLGLHRALFHNEHHGTLEVFRPYAMPDAGWLEEMASAREQANS